MPGPETFFRGYPMNLLLKHRIILPLLVWLFLTLFPRRAEASIPTGGEVVLIFVGVAVIGAAVGVGIYLVARKPPARTGCVQTTATGLQLKAESDAELYTLVGDTALIKPGDRVKVSGKRKKKDSSGPRLFVVDKVVKDYGACTVAATP